jgi:hypothetical protein
VSACRGTLRAGLRSRGLQFDVADGELVGVDAEVRASGDTVDPGLGTG